MLQNNAMFDQLKQTITRAGELALKYFGEDVKIDIKADGSQVSAADYAVNTLLQSELTSLDTSIGWLSEESPLDQYRLESQRTWIIDPIDGTRGFLENQPDWTIVAALVENGRPILAAVYNPVKSELYMAQKNKGAFLNDRPIQTNQLSDILSAHIISSKGHFNRTFTEAPQPAKRTWKSSMAYRIALIASGAADATISLTPKNDWDIAAAHLILEEAGGKLATHTGSPLIYNKEDIRHKSVVGASGELYNSIIERTAQTRLNKPATQNSTNT